MSTKAQQAQGEAAAAAEPSVTDAIVLMTQILAEMRGKSSGSDSRIDVLAQGVQSLVDHENARPKENRQHPGISSLNPLGERDHPRPELKCKMYWVGFKVTKDSSSREEIELLNRLEPGNYRVTKANGRTIPFTVEARKGLNDKLERMMIHFPCKSTEDRGDHMPMTSYLREALGEGLPNADILMKQVLALQAELAARKAAAADAS